MRYSKSDLEVVCTALGEPNAHIIKSHLESEGIPAHLRWETYGILYGLPFVGLGQVSILVHQELAEDAKRIIKSQDTVQEENEHRGVNPIRSAMLIYLLLVVIFAPGSVR